MSALYPKPDTRVLGSARAGKRACYDRAPMAGIGQEPSFVVADLNVRLRIKERPLGHGDNNLWLAIGTGDEFEIYMFQPSSGSGMTFMVN